MCDVIQSESLNRKQLDILRHALGIDVHGVRRSSRSHFVTDDNGADGVVCNELVAMGCMTRREGSEMSGGDPVFIATRKGLEMAMEAGDLDPPPKLPARKQRAKRRYDEYLRGDWRMSFGQWLKWKVNQ